METDQDEGMELSVAPPPHSRWTPRQRADHLVLAGLITYDSVRRRYVAPPPRGSAKAMLIQEWILYGRPVSGFRLPRSPTAIARFARHLWETAPDAVDPVLLERLAAEQALLLRVLGGFRHHLRPTLRLANDTAMGLEVLAQLEGACALIEQSGGGALRHVSKVRLACKETIFQAWGPEWARTLRERPAEDWPQPLVATLAANPRAVDEVGGALGAWVVQEVGASPERRREAVACLSRIGLGVRDRLTTGLWTPWSANEGVADALIERSMRQAAPALAEHVLHDGPADPGLAQLLRDRPSLQPLMGMGLALQTYAWMRAVVTQRLPTTEPLASLTAAAAWRQRRYELAGGRKGDETQAGLRERAEKGLHSLRQLNFLIGLGRTGTSPLQQGFLVQVRAMTKPTRRGPFRALELLHEGSLRQELERATDSAIFGVPSSSPVDPGTGLRQTPAEPGSGLDVG